MNPQELFKTSPDFFCVELLNIDNSQFDKKQNKSGLGHLHVLLLLTSRCGPTFLEPFIRNPFFHERRGSPQIITPRGLCSNHKFTTSDNLEGSKTKHFMHLFRLGVPARSCIIEPWPFCFGSQLCWTAMKQGAIKSDLKSQGCLQQIGERIVVQQLLTYM